MNKQAIIIIKQQIRMQSLKLRKRKEEKYIIRRLERSPLRTFEAL